ncbi:MAG: iron-sulfur cluster assembly accessory protein [Planctomycetes bacterium]|nr:iron-sulfur cluster assembly accessory protein [Planctomycetota bacterium]
MISLTERAAKELRRIVSDQNLPEGTVLRVGVKGGGCSGFSYSLGFDDSVHEDDQTAETDGFRVVCDPKSFLYLNGTQVDFEESLMGRGFRFGNPNASKTCGCGESFQV